jgi:hypothetical protein
MEVNPYLGKLAEPAMLVNVLKLVTAYYTEVPDPSMSTQRVTFGTSWYRGSAFDKAFNERYIFIEKTPKFIQIAEDLGIRSILLQHPGAVREGLN